MVLLEIIVKSLLLRHDWLIDPLWLLGLGFLVNLISIDVVLCRRLCHLSHLNGVVYKVKVIVEKRFHKRVITSSFLKAPLGIILKLMIRHL